MKQLWFIEYDKKKVLFIYFNENMNSKCPWYLWSYTKQVAACQLQLFLCEK